MRNDGAAGEPRGPKPLRHGWNTLALVLSLAGLWQAAPALGQAIDANPIHHAKVDASAYPWSSVGKLFNSVGGSCTGAVIARDKVLTAAHCLYAFRTHRFLPPDAIHVLLGYDRGDYSTHARVARYTLGPGYDPNAERGTAASDWAVLELAEPLAASIRPLKLFVGAIAPKTRIMVGGFARDRAYVMTADSNCQVLGPAAGNLISHDCLIAPGDSGAPLLVKTEGGEVRILGIAVGIWHVGKGQVGIAAPVPAELSPRLEGATGG
jgi:protease YdgD